MQCNREAPGVAQVAQQFEDDVVVVGVAGRGTAQEMADFVDRNNVGGLDHVADVDLAVWQQNDVPAQPAWVFVNGETGEARREFGELGQDRLRREIRALIQS